MNKNFNEMSSFDELAIVGKVHGDLGLLLVIICDYGMWS